MPAETVSEQVVEEVLARLTSINGDPDFFYDVSENVQTMYGSILEVKGSPSILLVHNGEEEYPADINGQTEVALDLAIVCGIKHAVKTWMQDIRRLSEDVKRVIREDFLTGDPLAGLARDAQILNTDVFPASLGQEMVAAQVDLRVIFRFFHDDPTVPV